MFNDEHAATDVFPADARVHVFLFAALLALALLAKAFALFRLGNVFLLLRVTIHLLFRWMASRRPRTRKRIGVKADGTDAE